MNKTQLSKKIKAIVSGRVYPEYEKLVIDEITKIIPLSAFKEKDPPNPEVKEIMTEFKALHERFIGSKVDINYPKDGAKLKELLKTKTKDEILKVAQWALSTESLERTGTTIPYILNSYVFTQYYKYRKENGYKD